MQFRFAHGPLEPEKQPVTEQRRVIEAIHLKASQVERIRHQECAAKVNGLRHASFVGTTGEHLIKAREMGGRERAFAPEGVVLAAGMTGTVQIEPRR